MTTTVGVQLPEYCSYVDVPHGIYCGIIQRHGTGENGREALFSEILSNHPYPRWDVVVELLEGLENEGKARAGLAKEVKEKYLTGKLLVCNVTATVSLFFQ